MGKSGIERRREGGPYATLGYDEQEKEDCLTILIILAKSLSRKGTGGRQKDRQEAEAHIPGKSR